MGIKVTLGYVVETEGWLCVESWRKLVKNHTLQDYPTPGGDIRVDIDQVRNLIEGKSRVPVQVRIPARGDIAAIARRARRELEALALAKA